MSKSSGFGLTENSLGGLSYSFDNLGSGERLNYRIGSGLRSYWMWARFFFRAMMNRRVRADILATGYLMFFFESGES
jgi:hypothetical protein